MNKEIFLNKLDDLEINVKNKLPLIKKADLDAFYLEIFGTHGSLNNLTKELPRLGIEERKKVGAKLNALKVNLSNLFKERRLTLVKESSQEVYIDPTLPGKSANYGQVHPISKIIYEVTDIFRYLGFSIASGPEVEWDEINFQLLRLDKNHPSRDTQETYYFNDEMLLRVHTSSVQIRYMQQHQPPIRLISPGRVYRRDQIDATHLPSFYQIEGLLVDSSSKLTDLLGTLAFFVKRLFGEERKVRFYGHNFPYTEPSLEVEVQDEKGNWLEILGCGMVHPEVLANCQIDPEKYRGWAFGMGADRLAMLKYGIGDIRLLYSGDLRFLNP